MSERVPAQNKTSATPPQATQSSSPLFQQRPFTDELSESFGSNSNISKELEGIQPKTIRRSLNWQNITVEAPSRSDGMSLPGGIQRQQEQPGALIGHQVAADSEQKSAAELSNSTISTDEEAPQPKIARARLDWRKISVEAPTRSGGDASPQPIQRQQEQQEETPAFEHQETESKEQKSAKELSNSTISTDGKAQQPKIARAGFNWRNITIEAPPSSAASSTYPGGIQRQETSDVKEGEESTESPQMESEGEIQAKCSECEQQEKEEQNKESIQTKLTVGAPGDKYEQEADSMAAKVMTMPDSAIQQPIQRQTEEETEAVQMQPLVNSITPLVQRSSGEEEEIQMKSGLQRASDGSSQASGSVENRLAGSKGGGSALPDEVRSFMEPRFGADFSGVRVHTDSTAVQMNKELGAQAFAHGSDIYYGAGKSPGKNELTAHELTHTVQQSGGLRAKTISNQPPKDNKLQAKINTTQPLIQLKENPQAQPAVNQKNTSDRPATTDAPKFDSAGASKSTSTTPTSLSEGGAKQGQSQSLQTPQVTEQSKSDNAANSETADKGLAGGGGSPAQSTSGAAGGLKDLGGASSAPAPEPQLNTSSTEGLLESLSTTPASSFGQAVSKSKGAATQIQSQEKSELETSLPEVERPTGLPRMSAKSKPETTIPQAGQAPEMKSPGGGAAKTPETKHEVAQGPTPASQVSTAVAAPPNDDGGGSWWNWLVNRVHSFLSAVPTSDAGLSTSAGSRPQVDLSGDANPGQMTQHQQTSDQEVVTRQAKADGATNVQFGENEIYPTVPAEKLRSSYKPTAPVGKGGGGGTNTPHLPDDIRATFDQHETPRLSPKVHEQLGQYGLQKAKYNKESQETRQEGQQRIGQETDRVRTDQQGMQTQARSDVDAERQRWREENRKIQEKYANQSKGKRQEIEGKIQEKVQTTDEETNQKLTEAENKAEAERKKTEQQAADKKREFENKPRGFWDSVKDGISSVFDSLKQAVNSLFEGLRQIVKGIIEAAKTAVRTLIEAARTVIVGLVKGFGEFLKGLVTVALFAFPETAAKAKAWIDKKIDGAVDAVNKAAENLKKATNAILDWVGQTLDKALSIVQGAFNVALDVLEFLAKAPFEAMELLEKFVTWLQEHGSFIEGLEKLQDSAAAIEAEAHKTLQGMIDQIPAKAHEAIEAAMQKLGAPSKDASSQPTIQLKEDPQNQSQAGNKATASPLQKHLQGIWRHLEPGLKHIQANWWGEVKQMVWNLVWPFNDKSPIWKDVPELIKLPGKIFSSIWNGQFSQAVDQFLLIQQKLNSILGVFYGWFFIASVLVGTIIGAFFGGAGAIPGAAAGAAFAGEVGEGLLLAMVATETAVIGKAVFDLAFGSGTEQVNESAYDRIANSGLTLGITGVMVVLSAIAGEIASELVSGIKSIFKGEVPEAGVKVEAPEVKGDTPEVKGDTPEAKGDTPEVKGDSPEAKTEGENLGTEGGKKVLAEEPTPDGHKVKVTEDGECLICSNCAKMRQEYAQELADPANKNLKAELDAADAITNPVAKAKAEAEIRQKLEGARSAKQSGTPESKGDTPEVKQPPSGMPEEFIQRRASLREQRAIDFFDEKYARMVRDTANRTPLELDRFRGYLDSVAKRSGGDLEQGLLKDYQKAHPEPVEAKPYGEMVSELPRLRTQAEDLIAQIQKWMGEHPEIKGVERIVKRIQQDLDGVMKDMEAGVKEASSERVKGFGNNLKGARGEFESAQTAPPGTEIGAEIPFEGVNGAKKKLEIDQISPDKSRWINIKKYGLFGLEDVRLQELITQAEQSLRAAKANPVNGSPPQVVFNFPNGLTPEVAAKLRAVNVDGQHLIVTGPEIPLK